MRLFKLLLVLPILLFVPLNVHAEGAPLDEAARLLPERLGDFRARGEVRPPRDAFNVYLVHADGVVSAAEREYVAAGGEKFKVLLITTRSDSAAYALLTHATRGEYKYPVAIRTGDLGTASLNWGGATFYKGSTFVNIAQLDASKENPDVMKALGRSLADTLDKGDGDIPVLVKHLPDWQQKMQGDAYLKGKEAAIYAISLPTLQQAVGGQPVLDAVSFEGGTEAVTAVYDEGRLAIVEYTTPQLATASDALINARIKELADHAQPVPSAYRRVGNYSVFVFDAPDEQAATHLIDSVSYEQVVQWLGDNPRALERAQKMYTQTTAGIILAVIKASGLAVLLCLGVGGIFGTIIFRRRRAQQAATAAYSDAGDMIRLNIDDLTPQTNPARLLGKSDG